jgi:hypothetical protein
MQREGKKNSITFFRFSLCLVLALSFFPKKKPGLAENEFTFEKKKIYVCGVQD